MMQQLKINIRKRGLLLTKSIWSRFIHLFKVTRKVSCPLIYDELRKTNINMIALLPSQLYSTCLSTFNVCLLHTNTNQRTSAITPEITSLIDISITPCLSSVLSCLTHTPLVPILNSSMGCSEREKIGWPCSLFPSFFLLKPQSFLFASTFV